MEKLPITAAGYAALGEELRRRQQEERPRIITMIAEARAHGDLSENAEYHSAKEQQSLNEGRIAELEDKIARAEAQAVSEVRSTAVDVAMAAAEKLLVEKAGGAAGAPLVDQAIRDLKARLN